MLMRRGGFCAAIAAVAVFTLVAGAAPVHAREAVPASTDFGAHHRAHLPSRRVILVSEMNTGALVVERRSVADDAAVAFAGSRPAWRLDIPLSWYFLTPAYVRDPGGQIPGDSSV
ncbi:hypothetical protein [Alicyclobacillus vulcanalis]|uniref:Uncharacterized protein n=1 Tax=Alicyclobacillus vulcanalis TaxID=252246 RepID=A0A1N7P9X0_9BACL|nr:hypothetical protein [Alicyclobacillus vulcanalis]SIT07239.1 hypothetical protein SAMN05421799_11233 [Alicyclobacillus vulcanalis]